MTDYEATFDIDSNSDAQAVRRLMEQVYDSLREELREKYDDETGQSEALEEFQAIRDATRHPSPGALTIHLDQDDRTFED